MTVQAATKLLDDFKGIPGRVERPRTFMEIAGYPRRENVCSNILKFFLDPKESHGLGTLVLDALASAGGIVNMDGRVGRKISVKREVRTDKGNWIDLLIETDTQVILVENKIDARSDNPFDDYAVYLDQIAEGSEKHPMLFTLSRNGSGSGYGFRNLTYDKFIGQIRSKLGHQVAEADTRYLTLFLDFLNTLENLKKGTRMNKEFVKLLADRQEQVEPFLAGVESLKAEMREKVKELMGLIQVEKHPNVEQLKPWQEPTVPYDDLPHNIRLFEDLVIQVETTIFPKGWEIWIHSLKGSYSELKSLLQRLEIHFEEYEEEGGVHHRDSFRHKYGESLDGISSLLQELIAKLATSQKQRKIAR